jgi:hypothetical protein
MRFLFLLSVFLTSLQALAGTAQVNNILRLGGQGALNNSTVTAGSEAMTIPVGASFVALYGGETGTTTNNRNIFTKAGTASQTLYQVPAGKTFYSPGFWVSSTSAHTTTPISGILGYNTSSFATKSAPGAGDIYYGSSATAFSFQATFSAGSPAWVPYPVVFPANSYPFWIVNVAENVTLTMVGYEQ